MKALIALLGPLVVGTLAPARPAAAELAYAARRDGSWRIYHQRDVAAAPQPIAGTRAGDESAPALSPDGRRVAFEIPGGGINLCPLTGRGACQVLRPTKGSAVRPAWHPVTGALVFVDYRADPKSEDSEICTTTAGLAEPTTLVTQTGIQDYPDVAPDGRQVAYTSALSVSLRRSAVQVVQQLWLMDLHTGRARQLLLDDARDIHPDWSPSGRQIAFASDRSGGFDIWILGIEKDDLRQLTSGPGTKSWPAWSPDGRSVMFTRFLEGRSTLWLVDADGSGLRPFEPLGPDVQLMDADWR